MNSKKALVISAAIFMVSLIISGCYRDKEDLLYGSDCSNTAVSPGTKFTAVQSLINSQCTSCHSPSGGTAPDLSTPCSIVEKWSSINNVCVIVKTMPPGGQLSSSNQQVISDWINAGHLYTN